MSAPRPNGTPTLREQFESTSIDPEEFDHRAHLRLAWEYLRELGAIPALERFSTGLKCLTRRLGIEGKYHETITGFLLLTMAERMQSARDFGLETGDFDAFARSNADLVDDARALLLEHYSAERLDSPLARRQFLLPDLKPPARAAGRQ